MPKSLSEDLRWRIVYLHHDGYSNKKIRSLLHFSRCTVGKVLRIYRKWGCVNDPFVGPRERRKLLMQVTWKYVILTFFCQLIEHQYNDCSLKVLKSLVEQKVDWYLDELVSEMKSLTGKIVSIPTLWRSLKFCGITRKKVCYKD